MKLYYRNEKEEVDTVGGASSSGFSMQDGEAKAGVMIASACATGTALECGWKRDSRAP